MTIASLMYCFRYIFIFLKGRMIKLIKFTKTKTKNIKEPLEIKAYPEHWSVYPSTNVWDSVCATSVIYIQVPGASEWY